MATPQSTASFQGGSDAKRTEQITFRFCSECSNMLYPKEDEDSHRLQFTCRTCQYTEPAQSSCIYRNELNTSAGETAGVTQDVGSDPTVSRLPASSHRSQDPLPQHENNHLPPFICLCCGCAVLCEVCGKPCSDSGAPSALGCGSVCAPVAAEKQSPLMRDVELCDFIQGWGEEDLFDDCEEADDDDDDDADQLMSDRRSDATSDSTFEIRDDRCDGEMVIDL